MPEQPLLDSEIAARLEPLWALPGRTLPLEQSVGDAEVLAAFDRPYGPAESAPVSVDDAVVPGPHGEVPVRVYRPVADSSPGQGRPGLVWMHGGAFFFGNLDMPEADEFARGMVARADAVVVSVDYRLAADGVHFPVPHDDVVAAYQWAVVHADDLGVDAARLAIGGASAGGNLAAGAALRLRDTGGPLPWQVLLAYPVLHVQLPEASAELARAMELVPPVLRFPPEIRDAINGNYLGGPADRASAYAFPALAEDLSGYPPTFVETSEFDDVRPSGEAFAAALQNAGVAVELVCQAGALHGHLNQIGLGAQKQALDRFAERLRRRGTSAETH